MSIENSRETTSFTKTVDNMVRSKNKREGQSGSERDSSRASSPEIRSDNEHRKSSAMPSDKLILEQNVIDLKSLRLEASEELTKRPKKGEIYNEVTANVEGIEKRLKKLSMNREMLSIDAAIEIADAAYLLRILRKPNHEIELAGQMAQNGALLMLQARVLSKKGKELLAQSKGKLQSAIP